MAGFNKARTLSTARPVTSPVSTQLGPLGQPVRTPTHEGAPGYVRDAQSELFLLGLSNMVGEKTFYETADARDLRFRTLIATVAVQDPQWIAGFLPWLRSVANMRTAPVVGAVEAGRALCAAGLPGARAIVDSTLQRADQPGEALAYWVSTYGRKLPIWLKAGVARAAVRLYTQRQTVRYDTAAHAYRFGRVVQLCRPVPRDAEQAALFRALIDRAYGRDDPRIDGLAMLRADEALRRSATADPRAVLVPGALAGAGWRFQDALPYADGDRLSKKEVWEKVIFEMGLFALVNNLRGFDEAGVDDPAVLGFVQNRLTDRETVRRSQMFPYRFFSAFDNLHSLRWAQALETALGYACANIPALPGRSLVLVDTSASMSSARISDKSTMTAATAAALFGVALALRHHPNQVDLYGFADGVFAHHVPPGAAALPTIKAFVGKTGKVGHGTNITGALQATFKGHDRVFLISDMQSCTGHAGGLVPDSVPIYGFNLGGYRPAYMPTGAGNRHEFGGLSDAVFPMVPILESRRSASWPWLDPALSGAAHEAADQ